MNILNILPNISYKNSIKGTVFLIVPPTVKIFKKITMITRPQNQFLGLLLCLLSTSFLMAETNHSQPLNKGISVFDMIYQDDEILDVTIETNLSTLIEERRTEEFQKGLITFNDKQLIVKLRPRGKFRRRICDFPPVKLKFPKKHLAAAGIEPEFNDLKLVTHCLDARYESKENVIKELLAYKMYQQLTDKSYRVQLVKITYIDANDKMGKIKRYGFIIEDTDEMAKRAGGKEYEQLNPDPSVVSTLDENTMAVFQYMIGNADYNLPMLRNLKMVQPKNGGELIPVPYDFDFSGLVNASYAQPNVDYGLKSVRERAFLGLPVEDKVLKRTFGLFKIKRAAIEKVINEQSGLSRVSKAEILAYIATFYDSLQEIEKSNKRNYYAALKTTVSPEPNADGAYPFLGK